MNKKNYWDKRNILITGGTGAIGKNLVDQLLTLGAKVYLITRDKKNQKLLFPNSHFDKCKAIQIDLVEDTTIKKIKKIIENDFIQDIFHLAAQSIPRISAQNPKYTHEVNSCGTEKMLEACRISENTPESIIIASSINAYGKAKKLPLTEHSPLLPTSPYDASKVSADGLARSYAETYNLPVMITRLSNTYGPGDLNFKKRIIPTLMECVIQEKSFNLMGGTQKRGFLYVKDGVLAYLTLAQQCSNKSLWGQAFNFGPDSPDNLEDIVNELLFLTKSKIKINKLSLNKNDPGDFYCSSEKAKKILNWEPKYSLKKGLKETFKWYSTYLTK